jgi:hypothetical protein
VALALLIPFLNRLIKDAPVEKAADEAAIETARAA